MTESQVRIAAIVATLFFYLMVGMAITAHAEVNDEKAVLAIIGEAENQGYEGMLAVACAIRNRGTLKGVYGLNAPRVKQRKYSKKIYAMASKAWDMSKDCDVTKGASMWENITAFGRPNWDFTKLVKTYECGDHSFYREVR